uniref:non-specific serine/threonine protein kinase n=2 Tax=Brassica campestris TaxID=3711 RepID=M4DSI1_BRACM|nr:Phototropin 1a [Brassica rapa subsp. pekinensis]
MEPTEKPSIKPSSRTLPRDTRGSLEVFNPSTFPTRPDNPVFRPEPPTWQNWSNPRDSPQPQLQPLSEPAPSIPVRSEEIAVTTSWMALKDPSPEKISKKTITTEKPQVAAVAAEQRAAEWGLVLKTDTKTGKPQGVSVRNSGGAENDPNGKKTSQRNSSNSCRSSGEMSDGDVAGGRGGIPRVSEDLKDALSTFQQTFVVSDATKPDYPIMYASAGFFNMTGYTSKEVVGRNCRFLQGSGTDADELAKIRESLAAGNNYCGRLLNYKKDGTSFWNLLTIAPIKDESGKVLKFIGMQVEVSKHTEGAKEKTLRPNGLPESLIRYDARQKDMATNSVTELVEAVKRPRALSESTHSHPFKRKSESDELPAKPGRRMSENVVPSGRRNSGGGRRNSMQRISENPEKKPAKSSRLSFMGMKKKGQSQDESLEDGFIEYGEEDDEISDRDERPESVDDKVRQKEMRKGMDLATTLERIEKNFVITDPRLPDNPIIFASDSFLELTEYSREEILGRNCRFLQGSETDPTTVKKIRAAIDNQTEVTVQLINYTKSGKKFWNIFHLQPMRDQKGEVQYFIGVQLDGSKHVEPVRNVIEEVAVKEGEELVKKTAVNIDEAVRELPDANMTPEDLWANHSKIVHSKPHRKDSPSWKAIQKVLESGEQIGLKHFRPVKPLGSGDTGSVHLVELNGTDQLFAMKAMDKTVMLNRNKVHRARAEREILDLLDHPFLPALYASFQTKTHICLITDYYPGGELFMLLDRQPRKVLKEDAGNGDISLTDFDLSCLTSCRPQLLIPSIDEKKKKKQQKSQQSPVFMAEPMRASNSFVGTEEYIAPEIITGAGHTSAVDWWALGILMYEMLYGYTPFRGKTRQKTFANVLQKDLKFPASIPASLQVKQLIFRLLQRDPKKRLGCLEGANEVKNHSFFKGINWALIRCTTPPELETPIFPGEAENGENVVDPELEDLQTSVF